MREIVKVERASKTYKEHRAVHDVSFSIREGEIVAILGPNGAGKTTTLSMILGLIKPTSGEVRLFGKEPTERTVRERMGMMLQEVSVMGGLKVKELLELFRHYYPNPLALKEIIALTALTESELGMRVEKLSGGQKRRLNFALSLAGNPDLLLFDEPTVGMDTTSRQRFWHTVHTLSEQGKTIIFTTHYLQEADDVAKRIVLFNQGRIVADDTPSAIKGKITKSYVTFKAKPQWVKLLAGFPEVIDIRQEDDIIRVETEDTDAVLALLFHERVGASSIRIEQGKLDEVFERLTADMKEVG
ncbi:ABC transporter ATP-binding protein [Paenibacillus aquistagni]|uniref:ABC-2 type transport system ATP-binding protein n=1 Tax=Paenibacillus aquistagni TaxID=1852522 RepID=A0A1X7LKV8_9BACL|nr:ABC transporter ATP-binding protein [Paenibacillus aquistagni]SMG53983.1 ABC-2 type transport system ATP-binding protein [Paenibacillus aquistagni]